MSLRRRLALTSGLAVALAVALASIVVYFVVRGQLRGQLDDSLRQTANGAEVSIGAGAASPAVKTTSGVSRIRPTTSGGGRATKLRPVAVGKKNIARAVPAKKVKGLPPKFKAASLALPKSALGAASGYTQVVTQSGSVLRARGESGQAIPADGAGRVASGQRGEFFTDVTAGDHKLRVLTAKAAPGLALQVARPLDEVDSSLHTLVLTLIAVTLGGALLAGGVGYLIARRTVGPVRELTEAAEHVARTKDLGRRIGGRGRDDELARLAASFDAMLAELESSAGAQRRLVADASHELRTPLTSLRTNIEVLMSGAPLAVRDREDLLGDVVSELDQLGSLVGDIVELAREEELGPESERPVRLDGLVGDAVRVAERRSPAVAFTLEAEPVTVLAAPERLARAIANLLDNASKWSPPGSEVEVAVRGSSVTVRDHGPGIDDADMPFIFERFYRAPKARSMPGSGLGLAIVHQAADAHGGGIVAEEAEGGGALLRLSLPPSRVLSGAAAIA